MAANDINKAPQPTGPQTHLIPWPPIASGSSRGRRQAPVGSSTSQATQMSVASRPRQHVYPSPAQGVQRFRTAVASPQV